ncbi:MAG: amino acid ABC transporter substrate-binding protein [Amphritea sp.]|nr:amino acid ABC transporter substrate-binding protein [Amphritea sp.]
MKKRHAFAWVGFGILLGSGAFAGTLQDVQSRGELRCGVNAHLVGFASQSDDGSWSGFDVSLCRAVAAAVLGDPNAVSFHPTNSSAQFDVLHAQDVDLIARNTTWNYTNDVSADVDFAGISFFDGQGFLASKSLGLTSAKEMDQYTVCVHSSERSQTTLQDFFLRNNMRYEPVTVESTEDASELYLASECQVYTADTSRLAALRATFAQPDDHVLLPEIISKQPLGPVVREGDSEWEDIIRWVLTALVTGEELGVTSANVEELKKGTETIEINRLLGSEGMFSATLGLDKDWAVRAIKADGNYGEIFAKTIGENTAIGLPRGLNAQWIDGGLLYGLPIQ